MKISLICFTKQGAKTCADLVHLLTKDGEDCRSYAKGSFSHDVQLESYEASLHQWAADGFSTEDALIFVGATGIAVRSIAPFLKDKRTDPAVLSIDEFGQYVIPLVSGHIGGANRLAEKIAGLIGAIPVITTATDLNHCFSVDQWAEERHMAISDMKLAKEISASLLQKKQIGFSSDVPIDGQLPEGLTNQTADLNIKVSIKAGKGNKTTLQLVPKTLVLGIGCRKGIEQVVIEDVVRGLFEQAGLSFAGIGLAASIDLKTNETGILEFCKKYQIPFQTYGQEALMDVKGEITPSAFVKSITGVDNVCERAALLASGSDKLLLKKQTQDGVAIAVAEKSERYYF